MIYISPSKERCEALAQYMLDSNATVRATAAHFHISKSTVHKDVTQVLKNRNRALYKQVAMLLEHNKQIRHIRGGEATRKKYEKARIRTSGN